MDDLPQPPSPQMVMAMGMGGALGFAVLCEAALDEAPRARAPAPAVLLEVPAEEGILLLLRCGRSRACSPGPGTVEVKAESRFWCEEEEGVVGKRMESSGTCQKWTLGRSGGGH